MATDAYEYQRHPKKQSSFFYFFKHSVIGGVHDALARMGVTFPAGSAAAVVQCRAHAVMSWRRFSR